MITKLVNTTDGSHTLYVPELEFDLLTLSVKSDYHSINGAIIESRHIFIDSGYSYQKNDPLRIFEVGFGTGLNALLTALECVNNTRKVFYKTIEMHPLNNSIIDKLNYPSVLDSGVGEIFRDLHRSPWSEDSVILDNFILHKVNDDLTNFTPGSKYDLIYFDAFSPEAQPELWTRDIIELISSMTAPGGVFITYSAKGELKRNLVASGYKVTRLPGPTGKRHIIRAVKNKY